MDMKKHWEKYNIPAIKTVEELLLKNSIVYGRPNFMNKDASFVASFAGVCVLCVFLGVLSFSFTDNKYFGIIIIIIIIVFFIVSFSRMQNIYLKYDTDPKLSDSKEKAKEILIIQLKKLILFSTGSRFWSTLTVEMDKAKEILTKMCEAGNFIGFRRLYPQLPLPMAMSWHDEIIQNKNYPSIAYALLNDNKIFNNYIKDNDVSAATIDVLIELGMDLEIFKNDATILDNRSSETKNAIATALLSIDVDEESIK